ncbi:MAG: FtsX-like permease family protein [Chloroflexota bacterium]|nr:FtsX-like permease family protein [Chloroflexota bacterium]
MDFLSNMAASSVLFMIGALTAILLILAYLSARNPVLMKIGLRNLVRRPTQAILIILGLTLSTIIIVSAFGTGDTLSYSVRRQAVAAYGQVDEIVAPPLLSLLANLADGDDESLSELGETVSGLTSGGLGSMLALVRGGLPSIEAARLEQLRAEAEADPLIDGVAGAIVFPTILRNTTNGASEPLGFIYAVDDQYPHIFGLRGTDGKPLEMTVLQPGIGNVFLQASRLFSAASDLAARFGGEDASPLMRAAAGLGAVFTGVSPDELPSLSIDLATLEELGMDTAPLEEMGIETLDLETLATALGMSDESAAQLSASAEDTLGDLRDGADGLLKVVNLNTLGAEIDRLLGQYGLQLRQGDLYLSRLAAERLGAQPGDVLEVFVGPLPVRFRVRAVVDQAGPLSALVPVVMLPLEEAQQLLFMNDRVNTVLVSNAGDEMGGLEHTTAVTRRLGELALDPDAVDQVAAILARPDVGPVVQQAAPDLLTASAMQADEQAPAILQAFIENIGQGLGMRVATPEDVDALLAAASGTADPAALRPMLSNTGIRSWLLGLDLPAETHTELRSALSALNQFEVIEPLSKATLLNVATVGGTIFSSAFSLFGALSILAAILLIFLIFVMLAAERRSEIGMARAVGTQRRQVVQMFVTEGMVYALAAAAIGVLAGIGVTFAMTSFIGQMFNNLTGQVNSQAAGLFGVTFNIRWQSVVISYCLGAILTFVVIAAASWRVSRMNIVSAIRDLPDTGVGRPRTLLHGIWRWLFPVLVAAGGVVLLVRALQGGWLATALLGASLLLTGLVLLAGRALEQRGVSVVWTERLIYTAIGLGLLALWALPWQNWLAKSAPDLFDYTPLQLPALFLLGGPLTVAGAIMVIIVNADFLARLFSAALGFIPSLRPVLKTAIAYSLNSRFRTGMTMLLFAMIMATVTVMAVVIDAAQNLVKLDDKSTAGFDIQVSSTLLSFFSPVEDLETALADVRDDPVTDDIAVVGQISREVLRGRTDDGRWLYAGVNGLNDGYIEQAAKVYSFQARAAGYADDAAVWEALRTREDAVIILPRRLADDDADTRPAMTFGRPPRPAEDDAETPPTPREMMEWEEDGYLMDELYFHDVHIVNTQLPQLYVELRADTDTDTAGEEPPAARRLQVIGVLEDNTELAWSGIQTSERTLEAILGKAPSIEGMYVKVREGADVRAVALGIERVFTASGLHATSLVDRFVQEQQLTTGILRLLQGFMALGLLVGIAALGVVSARAVVERRQQVGMLRAIGYQKEMVGLSFLLESSFISLCGLLIGALAGVGLGELVMEMGTLDLAGAHTGSAPWGAIGLTVLAAYLFSLLTTIAPVWQATRIYPAEALRYE